MSRLQSHREKAERYAVLRVVSSVCQTIGLLMGSAAGLLLIGGVALFATNSLAMNEMGLFALVVWSFSLFVAGVQSLALGSFLRLATHVEENTRATAQALERLRSEKEPKPEVDPRSIFLS